MPKLHDDNIKLHAENRLPLSDLKIHYAGQHIAVVVADTLERATHAAGLLKVSYAEERPVLELNDDRASDRVAPK